MRSSRAFGGDHSVQGRLAEVLAAIARRDEAAFGDLYEMTSGHLLAVSRAILSSNEDAKEVVIDVFSWLWRNADRYATERGEVMAWLAVITRRRAIDRLRKRRVTVSLDALGAETMSNTLRDEVGPDRLLAALQAGSAVHRALEQLTPLRRDLIACAFFQGLTHEEIAKSQAMPLGSVKSHLRRALLTLRQLLTEPSRPNSRGGRRPRAAELHHAIVNGAAF